MSGDIQHRSVVVRQFGGPEKLEHIGTQTPTPPYGYARIKILAAGVGYTDIVARQGRYILQRRRPFSPGYEFIGTVVDATVSTDSPRNEHLDAGGRVAACLPRMGSYTEYLNVPITSLVSVPDSLDTAAAAAVPLDYLTAHSALNRHARVKADDTVFIQGASGGVGRALTQLGELAGLTMYGTASKRYHDELIGYGLHPIDYHDQDYREIVRAANPAGVQAVFDHLGGGHIRDGVQLLAAGGSFVSYAFMGHPGREHIDTIRGAATNTLFGLGSKRTAICRIPAEIASDTGGYRKNLATLLHTAATGAIDPRVGAVFPLHEAAEAHRSLQQRTTAGKVILVCE